MTTSTLDERVERAVDHYIQRVFRLDTKEGRELAMDWRSWLLKETQKVLES